MRKYKSELYKVLHEDDLANFEVGAITEAELRELEKDCFIDDETPQGQNPILKEHITA